MHILVTNDDGPPSPQASPYVSCLVKHLKDAGHQVSVCLPHTQRSWIGKAHMIGQTLRPLYYHPSANIHGEDSEGTTHRRPSRSGNVEEWILIDGTPASCVQIGLHHFFQEKGPIDLVVSGPNYGRNTTSVFALSSGTLGGAMEAAVCRRKAIALSFAFFTRNHDIDIIEAACRHSVRVIEALYKQWPSDGSTDLYSVNVPLVEGVETHKTVWTEMLQNYWSEGSCFQETEDDGVDEADQEERIREGIGGEATGGEIPTEGSSGHKHKHFKWAPRFGDVYKSVEDAGPGNDGWVVRQGETSVTPLKANFAHGPQANSRKELELPRSKETGKGSSEDISPTKGRTQQKEVVTAVIRYEDPYVQPLIEAAAKSVLPKGILNLVTRPPCSNDRLDVSHLVSYPNERLVQIIPYEHIDFEFAASHTSSCLINSYMIRKALIRKHYLSITIDHWVAKNRSSILRQHVKRSETFELDYAEFLDDSLVEAFDLRESLDRNAAVTAHQSSEREWWILKPGMSDRGQGIRLFSTMDELERIFYGWEAAESSDSDYENEGEDDHGQLQHLGAESAAQASTGDHITTSHLRHFVAQPYIHPPLLLEGDNRKFHIRTYVLSVGSMSIYVYKPMLALFAAKPYTAPWRCKPDDIESFLTNTCLQDSPNSNTVRPFWDLPLPQTTLDDIFKQICEATGEVFEAAARTMTLHFQTLPNAFEVFGLDYLVDAKGVAWLLEVNAFPDFKQTGAELEGIVQGFWEGIFTNAVAPFFGIEESVSTPDDRMVLARTIDLGRR